MKSYVIAAESQGVKKYVYIDIQNSTSCAVDNKSCATPLPNRAVAFSVLNAVKPAIKKQGLDVKLSVEVLE